MSENRERESRAEIQQGREREFQSSAEQRVCQSRAEQSRDRAVQRERECVRAVLS